MGGRQSVCVCVCVSHIRHLHIFHIDRLTILVFGSDSEFYWTVCLVRIRENLQLSVNHLFRLEPAVW